MYSDKDAYGNPLPVGTCRIKGWNNAQRPANNVAVVPATATVNGVAGLKVIEISEDNGNTGSFSNMNCRLTFVANSNLKTIGTYAFGGNVGQGCGIAGALSLPNSLESLGTYAFRSNPITSLTLPENPAFTTVQSFTFMNCSQLTGTLKIPDNVTSIATYAFYAAQLTRLTYGPSPHLQSFGSYSFQGNRIGADMPNDPTSGIVEFPASTTAFNGFCFKGNQIKDPVFHAAQDIYLYNGSFEGNRIDVDPFSKPGNTFSVIADRCFAKNQISEVDFSSTTTMVPGSGILADNPVLTKCTISPYWAYIPTNMFTNNKRLAQVVIPAKPDGSPPDLRRVGASTFQNCTALPSLDFNNAHLADDQNGKAIGTDAFAGCTSLKKVVLGDKPYDGRPRNFTVSARAFKGCTSMKTAIMPPDDDSGFVRTSYYIGDEAFMSTDLGDYAHSEGALPVPPGTLPLLGRNIKSIGARAYENCGIENVLLPSGLTSVGDEAFADNKMWNVKLPRSVTSLGANVLAGQTPDGSVYWGEQDPQSPTKANLILQALQSNYRVDISTLQSIELAVPLVVGKIGPTRTVYPDNNDPADPGYWKLNPFYAQFSKSSIERATHFKCSFTVSVPGNPSLVSSGNATLGPVQEGIPVAFHWLDAWDSPTDAYSCLQWVGSGYAPFASLNGGNFGLGPQNGYHFNNLAYDNATKTGWKIDNALSGTAIDPTTVTAVGGTTYDFYNVRIPNSYSVAFDDNFAYMYRVDNALGTPDPSKPGSFLPEPNPAYVSGDAPPAMANLSYGSSYTLSPNTYKMGAYDLVGWATSPDLPEASRREGSNFFSPGSRISTPDPAPEDGGAVTLYAQWKAKDLTQDPLAGGSIMIPARIQMQQDGAHLRSASPDAARLSALGFDHAASLPEGAVPVWAVQGSPGASWPVGIRYQVFVKRSAPGASLLSLACSDPDADPAIHAVDVLAARDGAPYDPGPDAADPSVPLMELAPSDDSQSFGSFYLRSQDRPWDFTPNASYAGTMTFVLKQVGP